MYYNLNNDTGAIKCYDKALLQGESNPVVYFNRGNAHLNRGDYDSAISDFGHYHTLCPKDNDAIKLQAIANEYKRRS
jgi:tetratricopeptide (TPR) repeat protein